MASRKKGCTEMTRYRLQRSIFLGRSLRRAASARESNEELLHVIDGKLFSHGIHKVFFVVSFFISFFVISEYCVLELLL